jgi:hypothetical protein
MGRAEAQRAVQSVSVRPAVRLAVGMPRAVSMVVHRYGGAVGVEGGASYGSAVGVEGGTVGVGGATAESGAARVGAGGGEASGWHAGGAGAEGGAGRSGGVSAEGGSLHADGGNRDADGRAALVAAIPNERKGEPWANDDAA